jgi:hypothetical protein
MEDEVKAEESQKEKVAEEKPLDKMTAPELRDIAKGIPGVTGVHAMKKNELLVIVKEFREIKDEAPAKKKKDKVTLSSKELKLKIVQFREEKTKALEAKDKKMVAILRRRINRMKKKTRKAAQ